MTKQIKKLTTIFAVMAITTFVVIKANALDCTWRDRTSGENIDTPEEVVIEGSNSENQ